MAQRINVLIINAFTDAGAGGNPAGVVYPADGLSADMKQQIAARVGRSETAFVSASKVADFKLEFFTPTRQIAHCGHATIATFSYLSQKGVLTGTHSSKETIDGNRQIFLKGEIAYMEQLAPSYVPLPSREVTVERVLSSLSIGRAQLLEGRAPMVVSTGNSFMIIPLKDEPTLRSLHPDPSATSQISRSLDLIGYYAFTPQTQIQGRDAAARMFAPFYGIEEESATGMAAGPLACFLYDQLGIRKTRLVLEQGRLMPKPSPSEILVELELQDGKIRRLIAGGRARVMQALDLDL